jgi:tetratricopeptide (TPR) repeat protein
LGQVERQLGNSAEAITHLEKSVQIDPSFVDGWFGLGDARFDVGDFEKASLAYARTLALKPAHIEALLNRGTTLVNLKRFSEAVAHFDRIIASIPEHASAHARRGNALVQLKQFTQGLQSLERALTLKPGNSDWLTWKGHALQGLERYNEAMAVYEQALAIFPDNPWALEGIGAACHRLHRFVDAARYFDRALLLVPNNSSSLLNRGNALRELRRYDEALRDFVRAVEVDPQYPDAHFNRGVILLKLGRWLEAWPEYEWRWQYSQAPDPRSQPQGLARWDGKSEVKGKKILLSHEQGLGDTLQFVRYAKMVADRGAEVWLWLPKALATVLQTVPGVSGTLDRDSRPPIDGFALYSPIMGLPGIEQTTPENIPFADKPYLSADTALTAQWKSRLGPRSGQCRVGLMWRGQANPNLPDRSISLELLDPVLSLPCDFVSLQKDLELTDLEAVTSRKIAHYGTEQSDFADAAALIENCDLVITIDTSIAHLAGGMGKETWVILPYSADWRWFDDRSECLWYPNARLFRQPSYGDWDSPIAQVAEALRTRLGRN